MLVVVSWRSFMAVKGDDNSDNWLGICEDEVGWPMWCYFACSLKLFTPKGYFHRHYLTIPLFGWQRFKSRSRRHVRAAAPRRVTF